MKKTCFRQAHDVKVCRVCKVVLDENNFKDSYKKIKNWICISCVSNYDYKNIQSKPNKYYTNSLKSRYKITLEEYEAIYHKQNGKCKICSKDAPIHSNNKSRLFVDHCHNTNEIRGLLCHKCNSALGLFNDSIDIMNNAIQYLTNKQC